MNDDLLQTLPYRNGQLALTSTHLFVVHGKYVVQSLALKHIGAVSTEEAQSFRHRVWGLLTAGVLLIPSIALYAAGNFAGNVALLSDHSACFSRSAGVHYFPDGIGPASEWLFFEVVG